MDLRNDGSHVLSIYKVSTNKHVTSILKIMYTKTYINDNGVKATKNGNNQNARTKLGQKNRDATSIFNKKHRQ